MGFVAPHIHQLKRKEGPRKGWRGWVSAQRPIIVRRKANSGDDRGGDIAVPRKLSIDELGTRGGKLGLSAAIKRFG